MTRGTLAVAVHDVEPGTYVRCTILRDWLSERGIDRVTLLVIPAPNLHPFHQRRPELADWLLDRVAAGDAVAQHGFQHRQTRAATRPRQWLARAQGAGCAEFAGLDADDTHRAVEAGRRLLRLAGIQPRGFVAPAYAYTPALRDALRQSYDWWADLLRIHGRGARAPRMFSPALGLGSSSGLKRGLSPVVMRTGARASRSLLRLDLHPADLSHDRHLRALEAVLRRAGRRRAVTYDDLLLA